MIHEITRTIHEPVAPLRLLGDPEVVACPSLSVSDSLLAFLASSFVRVTSCDFVDLFLCRTKETIHEITRTIHEPVAPLRWLLDDPGVVACPSLSASDSLQAFLSSSFVRVTSCYFGDFVDRAFMPHQKKTSTKSHEQYTNRLHPCGGCLTTPKPMSPKTARLTLSPRRRRLSLLAALQPCDDDSYWRDM